MISVEINLDPLGQTSTRSARPRTAKSLATVAIWNDATGTPEVGNYRYAISHQHDSTYGARAAHLAGTEKPSALDLTDSRSPWIWKAGRVENFWRDKGAVALLAAVLKKARL